MEKQRWKPQSKNNPSEYHIFIVLEALSAARMRVIPRARPLTPVPENLRYIKARLKSYSVEDCLNVVAYVEKQVAANPAHGKWMNAITIFRPDNFTRYLGWLEAPSEETRDGYQQPSAEFKESKWGGF